MNDVVEAVYKSFIVEAKRNDGKIDYPISHIQILLRMQYEEAVLVLEKMIKHNTIDVSRKNGVVVIDHLEDQEFEITQ
jgi:hypothetical protein